MSDKPKCPQAIICLTDKMGVFPVNACMKVMPGEKTPRAEDYPSCVVTEYIPRHSINTLLDACQMLVNRSQNLDGSSVLSTAYDWTKLYVALQEFRPDA